MGTNQDYKNRALASLEGKWNNGAIASLIAFLLSGGVGNIVTLPMNETTSLSVSSLWSVLCLPLSWGLAVYFLNLIRNENIDYGRLFDGYRDFLRILLAQFCVGLCVLIGFIFLFIPGIIIGLMLSQTSFILKDDQQIGFLDAMKKSKDMMKGHKSELFWLTLSFIGWFILSCLTLGLGFLLLVPYWYSTAAHFYEDLKSSVQ
jgi:uncharacterized membrane protein